jgi:hypothetical protein
MENIGGIPPRVQTAMVIRLQRVRDTQDGKRRYINVYGRERGIYEYESEATARFRKSIADDWRECRQLLLQNGFVPRRVVSIMRGGQPVSLRA